MREMKRIEDIVRENMLCYFPDYSYALTEDPEDETVKFIRLYDVDDAEVRTFRTRLWEIIDEHLEFDGISFVPSVVSHTNTAKFYSDRLKHSCSHEDDLTLDAEELMHLEARTLSENKRFEVRDFLENSCFEYPSPVNSFVEDEGGGYDGEPCKLAA